MASTQNLNLVKPAGTDKALVSVINSNSDKIDAFAGTTNQAISTLNSNLTNIKNQLSGSQLDALPSTSSLDNGFVGFVLSQTITLGSETLLSGTRCIGFSFNGIAHVLAMPNGSTVRVLRGESNSWTVIAKLNGAF